MVSPLRRRRPPKEFSAHNFELRPGEWSLPGEPQIGREPISASHLRAFMQLCPPPARVADLGCLEGGHSVMLARAGYEVVGIEGQPENFAVCQWVAEQVELEGLCFIQDDVRNLRDHGEFDGVLCAGLLYHLDRPVEFLRTLGAVTRRLLIVSANHATREGREVEIFAPLLAAELSEHEGRQGRWFGEQPGPWSSLGNERSFWLEKEDLLRTLIASGFTSVFQQFDWLTDAESTRRLAERMVSVFVALKQTAQAETAVRNSS